jgi:DNA-directed RNA polymerase subunit A'
MKRAADFIDDMTKLSIRSIMFDGFSFGIDDEDLSKTEYGQIAEVLDGAVLDVQRRIRIYEDGQLEPMPGRTPEETLEMQIMQVLGKARDRTGEIAGRHLGLGNSAVVMAVSGARGSMLNLTQMAGCVGQQSVEASGSRGYDDRLSLTLRKETAARARFIAQQGRIESTEVLLPCDYGREGLADGGPHIAADIPATMINAPRSEGRPMASENDRRAYHPVPA